jgi:ubiquilin
MADTNTSNNNTTTDDTFSVNIQGSVLKFELTISGPDTILQVKEKVCEVVSDATVSSLKLIYSGKILKDGQTVEECGVKAGHTIHLVKSVVKKEGSTSTATGASASASPTLPQQQQQPLFPQPQQLPTGGGSPMDDVMAQMMEAMAQNPLLLQSFINHSMATGHQQQLNPDAMRMAQNPEFLRMAAQMVRSGAFAGMVGGGGAGQPGGVDPAMLEAMLGSGLGTGLPQQQQQQQQQQNVDPETRFTAQLEQLQDMGFWDKKSNIQALLASNGSVSQAVEYLLAHPPQ